MRPAPQAVAFLLTCPGVHLEHEAPLGAADGAAASGTALHAAVLRACLEAASPALPAALCDLAWLLEAGADANARIACPANPAWDGATPLHLAVLLMGEVDVEGMLQVLELLEGADRCGWGGRGARA